jgi:hypothetical protein
LFCSIVEEDSMGTAIYVIVPTEDGWAVEHDGAISMSYVTKEAAFEAAVPGASMALHDGHEVIIKVPGAEAPPEPALGAD